MSMATARHPEHSGLISSIMLVTGGIGGMTSPVMVGMVSDFAGLRVAFLLIGVMAAAGGGIYAKCCYKYLKE